MPEPINAATATLIRRANAAAGEGNFSEAQEAAREAVRQAETTQHQPSEAAAHYTLATMLWSDEAASAEEARINAAKALEMATPYTEEYYMSMTLLSRIEAGLGNLDRAQDLNETLLTIFKKKGRQRGVADVLRSFGDLALKRNELAEARRYFEESLTLYETKTVEDPLNQAGLLLSLGSLSFQENRLEEARHRWETAFSLGKQQGSHQVMAYASRGLAAINAAWHDE